jgi:dolichol kinase
MMNNQTQKSGFTVYDLAVFSFLFGSLFICWHFGALRTATLILSTVAVLLVLLVFLTLRASLKSPGGTLGAGRKFLHLVGGSALVLGVILLPSELPFLALSLLGTYLVYEECRWGIVRRQLWLSTALAFFGSPEETSRRPFWEAILGMTAISLVLSLFKTEVALAAIVNLTFGDGIAGLARERLGEEVRSFSVRKGWRGSLIGMLSSALVILMLTGNTSLLIPIVVGMIVERLPLPIDDNFTVPVSTALSAWLFSIQG